MNMGLRFTWTTLFCVGSLIPLCIEMFNPGISMQWNLPIIFVFDMT